MQKCCGVFLFRIMLSCGVSGRGCRGIGVNSGAAMESGKSIYFRGVEEWVFDAEEAVFVGRQGEYLYSGRKG